MKAYGYAFNISIGIYMEMVSSKVWGGWIRGQPTNRSKDLDQMFKKYNIA
ncbi:hypothetical protein TOT_040000870 [Theileria orientalis strain Shintoku]|uniref:Uncharacterized protein n=1 Tax=Theileria orientalis strain Shintoku TaxID=869250 RepID=J7MCG7_THEOR|nr:hypothetical protein TOT_040000870 [Theileria orientalis strain Shintoku]PVC49830.1 hypothetical protein MACL_00002708 [Theileria orientalis]BAM42502.1 hypothetical protein TOT_040000870 [Theileria orientalis strain Shintoku]|eukprot:XP_009692803.1 hypothetical protein TOT_040000870 [Theileria orientalis strain Shintoku]